MFVGTHNSILTFRFNNFSKILFTRSFFIQPRWGCVNILFSTGFTGGYSNLSPSGLKPVRFGNKHCIKGGLDLLGI
jgi:hypothetical protein